MKITIERNDGVKIAFDNVTQVYMPPSYSPGLLLVSHHNRYCEYFRVRQLRSWSVDLEDDGVFSSEDIRHPDQTIDGVFHIVSKKEAEHAADKQRQRQCC